MKTGNRRSVLKVNDSLLFSGGLQFLKSDGMIATVFCLDML